MGNQMDDEIYCIFLRITPPLSESKITFHFTRAIEIRAPDKDSLMAFGVEIGSGTALR